MTDYTISGPQLVQQEVEANDTLLVESVGSIVTSGDAILWDITPAASNPPGVVIVNDGLIQSTGDRAIDTTGSGTGRGISLTNHGAILGDDDAFRIDNTLTGGTVLVDNYGTISSTNDGQALDFNSVEGAASITIINRAGGLIHATDADGMRPGAGALIHNYGHIQAESDGDGIDFQDDAGGIVTNYAGGLIEGGKHGITGDASVTVYNAFGGTIAGNNGSAVNIDNGADEIDRAFVTNFGTMEGRSAETEDSDGDAVDVDGRLTLNNYGTIEGLGHEGYHDGGPNVSEGVAAGGGTINNFAGAVIFGYGRGIQIDNSDNSGAFSATTIYNEGLIEGAGNGPEGVDPADALPLIPIGNEAINLVGDWADTISNLGAIVGGVMMGGGADTLNNAGSIQALNGGAVDLGAGADKANLLTGSSITGLLNGGADTDTLNLLGTGTGTLSQVTNFEVLDVEGGTWTITDDQSYAGGVTVFAGAALIVGEGAASGALNAGVITNGMFGIDRSDVFTVTNLIGGNGSFHQLGDGTTILVQANGYLGGTVLSGGALRVSALGAVSNGAVIFEEGGQTLILDDVALVANEFENAVLSFGFGDAVEFSGLTFSAGTRVSYDAATHLVTVTAKDGVYSFTALGSAATVFTAESNGNGGTSIVLKDVGRDIRGTWKNDVIDGQKTVLGQPLPTDADDTIAGKRGDDRIAGLAGADELKGDGGDDALFGNDGDDWLYGGTGSNKLSGGAGFNAFVFDTRLGEGKAGKGTGETFSFAKIKGFTIGADQILLDSRIFKALEPGALSPDAFAIGSKAKSDDVHILYKNGNVRYDADGKGGTDAVLFAKVGKGLAIDADDFLVI